jgi:hypothetical protein
MEKMNKYDAETADKSMNPDVLDEPTPSEKMDLSESIPTDDVYGKHLDHGSIEEPVDFSRLDEDDLTVLEAMLGNSLTDGQGGSGGTGGDKTGERTPGGMSEDLTAGKLKNGTIGGPTGAHYTLLDEGPSVAVPASDVKGDRAYSNRETDWELSKRIAAENTTILKHQSLNSAG